ncbi:MAG: sigma-70 family RNA polymerase sigma factor [Methylococcales bacterium]
MNHNMTKVEEAWLKYQRQLFSFIRTKVATSEDAEDILNDVFGKLTKTAESAIPDNLSSWLYRVTKNRIVDYYRAKKKFEQLPENFLDESEDANTIQQLSKCMIPMIQALPEIYQHPLILSEIEGKKYKEVAVKLDLSVSAVKSRILRGREKLHKSMVSCCTIYRNNAGEVIDFEQKSSKFCSDC